MKKLLTINELRQKMPEYIEKIKKGHSFVVYKRSEPVFRISPVDEEGEWETIIDFTEIDPDGVSFDDIRKAAKKILSEK